VKKPRRVRQIPNRLKDIRRMKAVKQIDLSIEAGVSVNTISSIESHDYFPTAQVRKRICKALGVEHEAIWRNVSVGNE